MFTTGRIFITEAFFISFGKVSQSYIHLTLFIFSLLHNSGRLTLKTLTKTIIQS